MLAVSHVGCNADQAASNASHTHSCHRVPSAAGPNEQGQCQQTCHNFEAAPRLLAWCCWHCHTLHVLLSLVCLQREYVNRHKTALAVAEQATSSEHTRRWPLQRRAGTGLSRRGAPLWNLQEPVRTPPCSAKGHYWSPKLSGNWYRTGRVAPVTYLQSTCHSWDMYSKLLAWSS